METLSPEESSDQFELLGFNGSELMMFFVGALIAAVCTWFVVKINSNQQHREIIDRSVKFEFAVSGLERSHLDLEYYLLSGDPRIPGQIEALQNKASEELMTIGGKNPNADLKIAVSNLLEGENQWRKSFALPLIDTRKEVDQGRKTVADLQIEFLQADPEHNSNRFDNLVNKARSLVVQVTD